MSDTILKYQCPTCGGPVHFDANTQMIVCDYCGSTYPETQFREDNNSDTSESNQTNDNPNTNEKVDWRTEGFTAKYEVMNDQAGFICTSCGAEIVSDGNTAATECMYCGNPVVLTQNLSGMVKPDMVLPFKIDKAEAERKLKGFYNKKILLPKAFKDQNRIQKISGMYVPFWLFSGKGVGDINFDGKIVRTHREGDYEVTTTKHYSIDRGGSLEFEKIPVDASSKMLDNFMDGLEPYDYTELCDFSPTFMAGFFADKFDVDVDECADRARLRIVNSTENEMKNTVKGYTSVSVSYNNIEMQNDDVRYVLLPVWMLNTKFEGKMYHFAINGQTGKVSGDLPIDKKKQKFLFALIAVISFIPLAYFAYSFLSS